MYISCAVNIVCTVQVSMCTLTAHYKYNVYISCAVQVQCEHCRHCTSIMCTFCAPYMYQCVHWLHSTSTMCTLKAPWKYNWCVRSVRQFIVYIQTSLDPARVFDFILARAPSLRSALSAALARLAWVCLNLARLRAAISSASSICFL